MKKLLSILVLGLGTMLHGQSQINQFQILRLGQQTTTPANPPANSSYIYFNSAGTAVCIKSDGSSCFSSAGGTVTSIATTSPLGGGTITGAGTLTCTTCVVASSPGVGIAHFAGSTQTVTSSAIVNADITAATIDLTSKVTGALPVANGGTGAATLTAHGIVVGNTTSAVNVTSAGTSGQVLTSNGASADPTFQAASSGAMVQLETHAASTSATLDFTTCLTNSSYHTFKVKILKLVPATNSVQATLRMSTDGGATYDATSGIYDANSFVVNAGGTGNEVGLATTSMQIGWQSVGNTAANGGMDADFDIYDPAAGASAKVNVDGKQMYWVSSATAAFWAGSYHSTAAVNAFRILFSSGNITSGTVTCYGITP